MDASAEVVPSVRIGAVSDGYRLVGTEHLADAGFLTLSADRFVTPAGEEFTRYVVTHPGAVVAVPVDSEGAVFLVRQFRAAVREPMLELPAGKLDVPGEDPGAAVARELAEEIGHRPAKLVALTSFWNSPGFSTERTHVFLATGLVPCPAGFDLTGGGTGTDEVEERDMTIERMPLPEAVRRVGTGEITDGKTIVGLLLADRWLAARAGASR